MRGKKVDQNQEAIVKNLRKMGASVALLAPLGSGVPDLLCGYQGRNYLLEIKNPKRSPSKRKLTSYQVTFFELWRGQIDKVETLQDACRVMNIQPLDGLWPSELP